MQRATLLAFIGKVKRNALLQGLEKLVKRVAGGEASRQLGNIGPVAAILDVNAGG